MLTRRDFFRSALGAAAWTNFAALPLLAQGEDYRALVCVFLFGGNDCNNTVVPLDADVFRSYQASRGPMALARQSLLAIQGDDGKPYGLHPRLRELQRLYEQRRAAILVNVGVLVRPLSREEYRQRIAPVPVNLFSHSDQQLQWQSADPHGGARSGWGGRVAEHAAPEPAAGLTAVSLSGTTPYLNGDQLRGVPVNAGAPVTLAGFSSAREHQARLQAYTEILDLDVESLLVRAAAQRTREGLEISRTLTRLLSGASPLKTVFPATTLGRQMETIARLIRGRNELGQRRQIFFASLGGWDHHINLLASHDPLMSQLDAALGAFYQATEEMGVADRVITFTASEFGRTLNANANAGSDHGWGGHHFVIGAAVKGGRIYGRFPELALNSADDATGRGVWIPTTSLDQYGATLAAWFGVPGERLEEAFPNLGNFAPRNLGFLD